MKIDLFKTTKCFVTFANKSVCLIHFLKSCCAQILKAKSKIQFFLYSFEVLNLHKIEAYYSHLNLVDVFIFFCFAQSFTCLHQQITSSKIKNKCDLRL